MRLNGIGINWQELKFIFVKLAVGVAYWDAASEIA